MSQRDDLRTEAVHTGEHRRIGAGGGYVGAVRSLKERTILSKPVYMRGGVAVITVATHVVGKKGINADEKDIRFRGHRVMARFQWKSGPGECGQTTQMAAISTI